MQIRNLIPDYLEFERRRGDWEGDPKELWDDGYASRHPDVFELYRGFGEPEDFAATLESLAADRDTYESRAELLTATARDLAPRVAELLDAGEAELSIVLMVGLGKADGWMEWMEDVPTAFFAVERFRKPPWERVHVTHELTHLIQANVQEEHWAEEPIGLRLLIEGIAIASTHRILPDCPTWSHFNQDPEKSPALMASFRDALPDVAGEMRGLLRSEDERQAGRFFYPDWMRKCFDVPERVGYYAGWRVVEDLLRSMSMGQLIRLDSATALDHAAAALDRQSGE